MARIPVSSIPTPTPIAPIIPQTPLEIPKLALPPAALPAAPTPAVPTAPRIDPTPTADASMSLLSTIGKGIVGFASGGIGGALAGIGTSLLGSGGATATSRPSVPTIFGGGGGGINMPFPVSGPGGQPLPGYNPQGTGGSCPRGYHLNKHALAASHKHGAVGARSICVRNRHINPMNPRAISRSLRRIKRAGKIVRRLHAFAPVRHQQRRLPPGRRR